MKTPIWHNPNNVPLDLVDPKNQGWRLMLVEEIIQRNPTTEIQMWRVEGGWNNKYPWAGTLNIKTYRTKFPLPAEYLVNEDQWITDRRPTKEDGDCDGNVWAYSVSYDKAVIISVDLAGCENSTYPWMPTGLKRPENPPKEKTQLEKDKEALLEARKTAPGLSFMEFDAGWNAGVSYTRGDK